MPVSLRNQVVLVVGASSGIGAETARLFAREGARVMASARRQQRLQDLQQALAAEGFPIEVFAADAGDSAQMLELGRQTVARCGPVDILVYATGTNTPVRALKLLDVPTWDHLINVNLNGAYYITQALLPSMRERGAGHLIYIASISAVTPDISGAAYQASKRGMLGSAHAIRVEEKQHGIRTCVVSPGLVDTEILDLRPIKPPPETLAQALRPADVAEAVLAIAKLPARAAVPELQIVPTTL